MASAAAKTSFEEKPGKPPDFFRKIIVGNGLPCLADPADRPRANSVGGPAAAEAPFQR
jgi:hypothetical protein